MKTLFLTIFLVCSTMCSFSQLEFKWLIFGNSYAEEWSQTVMLTENDTLVPNLMCTMGAIPVYPCFTTSIETMKDICNALTYKTDDNFPCLGGRGGNPWEIWGRRTSDPHEIVMYLLNDEMEIVGYNIFLCSDLEETLSILEGLDQSTATQKIIELIEISCD